MLYITAIHLGPGRLLQHITDVQWLTPSNGMTVAQTIAWMEKHQSEVVQVAGKEGPATVRVVRPHQGAPYIRTSPDNSPSDNLLALPQF